MVTIRSKKGYSLVELMLVTATVGTLALIAPKFIKQMSQFFILSQTRIALQQEARAAMALITKDLRQAQSSTIQISQASSQPPYSRIRFTTIDGRTVSYYQSGTKLIMQSGTTNTKLSDNLRYLAFTFPRSDDMTILSVATTLEKSIYQGLTKALHMASERVRVMN